jgi:hypothetical protein
VIKRQVPVPLKRCILDQEFCMEERDQILYMQIRLIRLAAERWNMSMGDVSTLFAEHKVLDYIEKEFGIFHTEGDEAVFIDISEYLKSKGALPV